MAAFFSLTRWIAGIVVLAGLGQPSHAQQNADAIARQYIELSWLSAVARKCNWAEPVPLAGLDAQLSSFYAELTIAANPDGKTRFDAAIADARKRGEAVDCAAAAATKARGVQIINEQAGIALMFASRLLAKVPPGLSGIAEGDAKEVSRAMARQTWTLTLGPMKPLYEATTARADLAAALICHPDLFRLSEELTKRCGTVPADKLAAMPLAKEALKHVAAFSKVQGETARAQRARLIAAVGPLKGFYGITNLHRECDKGLQVLNVGAAMRRQLDGFDPLMLTNMHDLGSDKPPEPVLFVIKASRKEPGFDESLELQIISFSPGELHLVTGAVTGTHIAKPGAKPSSGIVARTVADQMYRTYIGKALAASINGTAKTWRALRCPYET